MILSFRSMTAGVSAGPANRVSDGHGSVSSHLTAGVTGLTSALSSPDSFIEALQAANTRFATAISGAASDAYATLLPTADIVNALLTSVPAYDVNLFLSGIQQALDGNVLGGLQYALIAPLAASTGLLTMAAGFELEVLLTALLFP